jgi:hypothetical protein
MTDPAQAMQSFQQLLLIGPTRRREAVRPEAGLDCAEQFRERNAKPEGDFLDVDQR